MSFGGKTSTSGQGRPKGSPNKTTRNARAAIARFVDGNAWRFEVWLKDIAEGKKHKVRDEDGKLVEEWLVTPDPRKAFELLQSVLEYHVPKLARSEVSGPEGGPIDTVWTIKVVKPGA